MARPVRPCHFTEGPNWDGAPFVARLGESLSEMILQEDGFQGYDCYDTFEDFDDYLGMRDRDR